MADRGTETETDRHGQTTGETRTYIQFTFCLSFFLSLLKAPSPVNRTGSPQGFSDRQRHGDRDRQTHEQAGKHGQTTRGTGTFRQLYLFIYLFMAPSPVNRTGSPQGFSDRDTETETDKHMNRQANMGRQKVRQGLDTQTRRQTHEQADI